MTMYTTQNVSIATLTWKEGGGRFDPALNEMRAESRMANSSRQCLAVRFASADETFDGCLCDAWETSRAADHPPGPYYSSKHIYRR